MYESIQTSVCDSEKRQEAVELSQCAFEYAPNPTCPLDVDDHYLKNH